MMESDFTLSSIEKDTIGEIMNISMGSAATAISTMLARKVSITTPEVVLADIGKYEFEIYEPSVCTEIKYINGLDGTNLMIMKLSDIKSIVNILIGSVLSDDEGLDEMHLSAIGEIMNQMMGSSSTALSGFLGKRISISIPDVYELEKIYENISKTGLGKVVIVKFRFKIEDVFDSEFVSLLPINFSKELVEMALNATKPDTEKNKETKKTPKQAVQEIQDNTESAVSKQQVNVKPLKLSDFEEESLEGGSINEDAEKDIREYSQPSFNLIMDVPLEVTVEIGHARKQVKEILELRQGSIIELDKQAGDPVDIIVNGRLLARGDVVVVDDNFGVRITEIISNKDFEDE